MIELLGHRAIFLLFFHQIPITEPDQIRKNLKKNGPILKFDQRTSFKK